MDIIDNIEKEEKIQEAAYKGNLGAVEMITFYQKASNSQIREMEKMIRKGSWEGVKKLIKKVLGVSLI